MWIWKLRESLFCSYVIWINRGTTPTIMRASLDGSDIQILHTTGLIQPGGITMDYAAQKMYWTDTSRRVIESSYFDGSRRELLISLSETAPFSITLQRRVVYWTDATSNAVFAINKEIGSGRDRTIVGVYVASRNISSVVTIVPNRQRMCK